MTLGALRHSSAKTAVEARRAAWNRRLGEELDRLVGELRRRSDVERVMVFGSFARGESRYHSDLDMVVVQRTGLPFRERLESLYRALHPRVTTDLLVYTPLEWDTLCAERAFAQRLEREGKTLYANASP